MQRSPRKFVGTGAVVALSSLLVAGVGFAVVDTRQARVEAAQATRAYTPPVTYTPPPSPTEVAFLGDSFTVGTGAEGKFNRWTSLIARNHNWDELNYGLGGTNFNSAGMFANGQPYYERMTDLIMSDPDIVIVSSAGNGVRTEDQQAGIDRTFKELREALPEAQIFAVSPIHWAGEFPEPKVPFGGQVQDGVEAVGGKYLDIGHPLERRPDAISDVDDVHPNNTGHRVLADAVEAELAQHLDSGVSDK